MTEDGIHPRFGTMRGWGIVSGAPLGSIEERAEILWGIARESRRPFEPWPIAQTILRAMTVELMTAFCLNAKPPTPALLKLLTWATGLSSTRFLEDPFLVYEGRDGRGQSVDEETRAHAEAVDAWHLARNGKLMSQNALAKTAAISQPTARAWQNDSEYLGFVQMLSKEADWSRADEAPKRDDLDLRAIANARAYFKMARSFDQKAGEQGEIQPL